MATNGVANGQLANQTTFNNGFVSRGGDTDTLGKLDLINTDPLSGPSVINTQKEINSLDNYTGRPSGSAQAATPSWTSNEKGSPTDTLKARAEAHDAEYNSATGHTHNGSAGEGGPISAGSLSSFNNFMADWQTFDFASASGTSTDVSTPLTGKTPGGAAAAVGVYTTAPDNRCMLVNSDTETAIEDAGGQRVYGRLTESATVWTLTYYTNEAGVETAHTLASQNIRVYFAEVFTMATRPTRGADTGQLPSLDMTADIVDASPTQAGKVSVGTQAFGGLKEFSTAKVTTALQVEDPGAGTFKVVVQAPTLAADYTLTLPVDDGTSSQVLTTNGSGVLSWTTPSAGSSASGFIKVRLADTASSALPTTGVPVTIDQVLLVDQDLVLFTNLSSGNNKIHKATVSGGNVTAWTLQTLFEGASSTASDQDFVAIKEGAYYADNVVGYNGTGFFNFLDYKISQTLTDNLTNQVFLELNTAVYRNVSMEYSISRGATTCRNGMYWAISNGSTAAQVDDPKGVIGSDGVSFSTNMSGTTLQIRYTTTSTGTNATMKRVIRIW